MTMPRFAPPFQDHAVLQRDHYLPIWGTAPPGARIEAALGTRQATVTTNEAGHWMLRLPPMPAGGPFELTARGAGDAVVLRDIWLGDVWLCSGQSNAEWPLHRVDPEGLQSREVRMPLLRLLTVSSPLHMGRNVEVEGTWRPADPESLKQFSAVGGWFGRTIQQATGVPVGIITNAWGGTRIQSWISREGLMTDAEGRQEVAAFDATAYQIDAKHPAFYPTLDEWARAEGPSDAGNRGLAEGWAAPDHDDRGWKEMDLPAHWQQQGHPGSGVLWFRRSVSLPAAWLGRDLRLELGPVDKHDDTYVNGIRVGGISWEDPDSWRKPRSYAVPSAVAGTSGHLVIAVRARSHVFDGGLNGPAHLMRLRVDDSPGPELPLSGRWRWKVEQDWGVVAPPAQFGNGPGSPNAPAAMFDCRMHPLLPYGLRGVIWYQGESNAHEPDRYRRLLPLLIQDWRRIWGQASLPFLVVQLPNYGAARPDPGDSTWAGVRDAQLNVLALRETGLAVTIDVGEAGDIHPWNKRPVGERLARWAMAGVYHRGGTPSGPLFAGCRPEAGGRLRIHFRHAHGLGTLDGGPVGHLAIADARRAWRWAESKIEGETLVVWHPEIPVPAAVRYAWADNPEGCNLVNGEGMPASPFDTTTSTPVS